MFWVSPLNRNQWTRTETIRTKRDNLEEKIDLEMNFIGNEIIVLFEMDILYKKLTRKETVNYAVHRQSTDNPHTIHRRSVTVGF